MVESTSTPEKYFGSRNLCDDIEITHYILTGILTYSLSSFLTPILTWVPAFDSFDSLIMHWRFHSYEFKHAVLGRFKHSIQHSDWQNCSDSMWRKSWHSIGPFLWTVVWHFIRKFIWHIFCKSGFRCLALSDACWSGQPRDLPYSRKYQRLGKPAI